MKITIIHHQFERTMVVATQIFLIFLPLGNDESVDGPHIPDESTDSWQFRISSH